jgi:hypothetical protein
MITTIYNFQPKPAAPPLAVRMAPAERSQPKPRAELAALPRSARALVLLAMMGEQGPAREIAWIH